MFVLYLLPYILLTWHLMVNEDTHHLRFLSVLVRYHSRAVTYRHFSFLRPQILQCRFTSPQISQSHPMLEVFNCRRFSYVIMGSHELKWVSIETRQRTTLPSSDGRRRKEKLAQTRPILRQKEPCEPVSIYQSSITSVCACFPLVSKPITVLL